MAIIHPTALVDPKAELAESVTVGAYSIIGPNVTIGEKVTISYSVIKDSIIGAFADLSDIVLTKSLIGSDTEVKGESRSLNIGDNTEIDLGES